MSEVSDAAIVRVLIADYAAIDAAGKLNIVGGGLTTLGYIPNTGLTSPFVLVVSVAVPPAHSKDECAVEIILEDLAGDAVALPGPAGEPQAMRVGQVVRFEEPTFPPGMNVPRHSMRAKSQWVLGFSSGLPLAAGQRYVWRVKIDHESRDDWTEEILVPGPVTGPVLG